MFQTSVKLSPFFGQVWEVSGMDPVPLWGQMGQTLSVQALWQVYREEMEDYDSAWFDRNIETQEGTSGNYFQDQAQSLK